MCMKYSSSFARFYTSYTDYSMTICCKAWPLGADYMLVSLNRASEGWHRPLG